MMKKKVSRILVAAALCTMLVSGPVSLAHFSFILENTGQEYSHYSGSMNKKVYISNPWTLKVQEISCSGPYGIRFIPVQCSSSGAIGKKCTQSGIWKSGTGRHGQCTDLFLDHSTVLSLHRTLQCLRGPVPFHGQLKGIHDDLLCHEYDQHYRKRNLRIRS